MYCLIGQCVVFVSLWFIMFLASAWAVSKICFSIYCRYPELVGRLWMDQPLHWLQLDGARNATYHVASSIALHIVFLPVMVVPYLLELAARILGTTLQRPHAARG